jgi:homoserine kinase
MDTVSVFAPASTGNIGPGFDVLGMALAGIGDTVTASRRALPGVVIDAIIGEGGRDVGQLPKAANANTAGISAQAVIDELGCKEGVTLTLQKGIPGTGLGSSAASAVAAAFAVNALWGGPLSRAELIPLAAVAEQEVSGGFFLDNIGPSMMGGVTWNNPHTREVVSLGPMSGAVIVLAIPETVLLTKLSRQVLPQAIPMATFISNMAHASLLAWAVAKCDVIRFGQAIQDGVAEPARAPLIRGFKAVKNAALAAGAWGCSISGAGATVFAVTDSATTGAAIGEAMKNAFEAAGVASLIRITTIDPLGARIVGQTSGVCDHAAENLS